MTRATRRAARKTVTIWQIKSKDQYSGVTYDPPYTENVTFEQGATRQYNDNKGNSFIPKSIYWYELTSNGSPALNAAIALGDHLLQTDPTKVNGVEFVRVAKLQDGGRQTDDVMVLT